MYIHHLDKMFLFTLGLLILTSCQKRDTSCLITGIRIYPVTNENNTNEWIEDGWYFSKFQNKCPCFIIKALVDIDYEVLGLTEYNHFYWDNYPVDSSLTIFTEKPLIINQDTIRQKSNLVKYFNVSKKKNGTNYRSISYELSLKDSINVRTNSYYTFFSSLEMNDGTIYSDSCIICFN